MQHLLSLGHRRIGAITGPNSWIATEARRRGYLAALSAAGIAPVAELVIESDFVVGGGIAATRRLLDLPEPPTAIFAFNDNLAVGALHVARERGHFRGPLGRRLRRRQPGGMVAALTTVRQPLAEMGRMAVSLLTR
jgi:LacI family transcriptional regulator